MGGVALEIRLRVDIRLELWARHGHERRMRTEASCASCSVQRSEGGRVRKGQRICGPVFRFDEREAGGGEFRDRAGGGAGKVGVDDERMSLHSCQPSRNGGALPSPRIRHDLRAGRDRHRIVRHDDDSSHLERCRHDVPEHRHGDRAANGRREPPFRVATVGDHDGRHAPKRSQRRLNTAWHCKRGKSAPVFPQAPRPFRAVRLRSRSCCRRQAPTSPIRARRTSASRAAPCTPVGRCGPG